MPDDQRERTIALVKAALPALGQQGSASTRRMYAALHREFFGPVDERLAA
jgi:hemoglobin-like flavoprotein